MVDRPSPDEQDRGHRVRAASHSAPPAAPPPSGVPEPIGRHCWVFPPRESSRVPRAGLLLEWRRTATGFEGLVVYLADLAGGRRLTQVQEWVAAEHLRPRS